MKKLLLLVFIVFGWSAAAHATCPAGQTPVTVGTTTVCTVPAGQANGLAQLNSSGKVPTSQLPVGVASGVAGLNSSAQVPVAQLPVGTGANQVLPGSSLGQPNGPFPTAGGTMTGALVTGAVTPPVVNLYTSPPATYFAFSPGGARLSVNPIGGHAPGDTIRTQQMVETLSGTDASIEESSSIFDMAGVSGYAQPWEAAESIPTSTQIHGSDGGIFINSAPCTTGSGPAPSGTTSGQSDGGCTWNYVGIGGGDGKSAQLLTTVIYAPGQGPFGSISGSAGGGQGWGQAIIAGAKGGAWPNGGGFLVGQEIDAGNQVRDCPPAITNGCSIFGSFINGNGNYPSTAGIFIGGTVGFHVGIQFSGNAATDTTIADASNAATGILEQGTKEIASYRDLSSSPVASSYEGNYSSDAVKDTSTSPTAIYLHGTHSFAGFYDDASSNAFRSNGTHAGAAFLDQSTTPYGLRLLGTYSQNQIAGTGFSVDPVGNIASKSMKLSATTVASLPSCNGSTQDEMMVVTDASSPTYNGALTGGGAVRIPVYCNGSAWTAH